MISHIIGTIDRSLAYGVPVASSVVSPFCRCQYKNFVHQNGTPRRTSERTLMRKTLLIALLAFTTGSLLVYFFGDSGLTAYNRLSDYRDRLDRNVTSLDTLNRSLQAELASLRDDPRRTEVLARDLGLYRPEDRVLRIEGSPARVEPYEVGALLRLKAPRRDRGPWLKTAGLGVAVIAALAAFLFGRRGRRPSHGARRR